MGGRGRRSRLRALSWTLGVAGAAVAAAAAEEAGEAEEETYGARLDPWLKNWTQGIRVSETDVLLLQLYRGELTAFAADGSVMELPDADREALFSVFPLDARVAPVTEEVWSARERRYARGDRYDPSCPVNAENHLEKTLPLVYRALRPPPPPAGAVLNVGGLYGGRDGEGAEAPDDPTVELLRELPGARVLCWHCGEVSRVTRLGNLASRFERQDVDLLAPELEVPEAFRRLDLLRLDALPAGQSCQVLSRLLRAGVRPRLVAMYVMSQIPPPFKFMPLATDAERHPPAFGSCSLAAAADVLDRAGLSLLRLTGPYALFVERALWREPLPLNDLDCYRRADVWGLADLPLAFVRDWLFAPVEQALPRLWGNISDLYLAAGHAKVPPFALSV